MITDPRQLLAIAAAMASDSGLPVRIRTHRRA